MAMDHVTMMMVMMPMMMILAWSSAAASPLLGQGYMLTPDTWHRLINYSDLSISQDAGKLDFLICCFNMFPP
jgi:hypothetical protein